MNTNTISAINERILKLYDLEAEIRTLQGRCHDLSLYVPGIEQTRTAVMCQRLQLVALLREDGENNV